MKKCLADNAVIKKNSETDDVEEEEEYRANARDRNIPAKNSSSSSKTTTSYQRHGARNQHKMKDFVKWLVHTFPSGSLERVLDVASGKGELAARLAFCHQSHVTLIDPRGPADVASVFLQHVLKRLPLKWQQRLQQRLDENEQFVQETALARCRHFVCLFTEDTVQSDPTLKQAVQDCSLLIGMHADSATECIVDMALIYNKPFVVVPCCVFPNLYTQRKLFIVKPSSTESASTCTTTTPVRSWEQFCDYLLQKDDRILRHTLPFEGRNVAIYWLGTNGDTTEQPCLLSD